MLYKDPSKYLSLFDVIPDPDFKYSHFHIAPQNRMLASHTIE